MWPTGPRGKETVRHQASCEELRRASQVSRVLLYSSNSNGVFVGRVSRAYVQHFMMPGACYQICARCVWYQVRTVSLFVFSSVGGGTHESVGGGTHDTYVPTNNQLYRWWVVVRMIPTLSLIHI